MKDLTSGNIYKNFIFFAFPMVLSGLLSQAYSTIDTVIAGKYIGEAGLGAIGATAPLVTAVSSAIWGLSVGLSVYVASLFGAKEYRCIKNVLFTALVSFFLVIVTVSVLLIVFTNPILSFLKVDADILKEAGIYFKVYISGLFFITMNTFGVLTMNAFGISTFPFVMSLLSAFLNISGNIFTVTVLDMGVFGIALSSVVAAVIVDIGYLIKLSTSYRQMGVADVKPRFTFSLLLSSANYSLPNMFQQVTMYFSGFVISPFVNSIGESATAAYTVVHRIYEINATVYQNSSKTVANFVAQAKGAGKTHLYKKAVKVGLIQSFLFVLPFVLVCSLFPEAISNLFFEKGSSVEAINYSVTFLSYFLPFIFINVVANLFHAFFRGLGEKSPLLIATLVGSLARVIVTLIFIPSYKMLGMYIGWVASWVFDAIVSVIYYVIFRRKNKNTEKSYN